MQNPIEGKRAIVTGGTRGIGRAIAQMLLKNGADVAVCGRVESDVAKAVSELAYETGGRVFGAACDVTNRKAIRKFFEYTDDHLTSLNILVNNAGIGIFQSVADMSEEAWQSTIETNLSAAFYFSRLAVERFRKSGGGYVVNIGSLAGRNAFAGGAAYNASKFGLIGFGEAMLLDHRMENVRVTTILPGSVATEFGRGVGKAGADWKIQPEDIAEVVRMVVSMPARTMVSCVEMRPSKPAK